MRRWWQRATWLTAAVGGMVVLADPATGGFYRFRAVAWPTADPLVTGVGGTTVRLAARGAPAGRPAAGRWDIGGHQYAGGGGLSAIFRRPAWQNRVARVVGDRRGVVDISMDARAWARLGVPGQPGSPGWTCAAGTSVSAPLLAGLVADAAHQAGHSLGLINPALYQMHGSADGITDITRGANTDHGVPGYPARRGYDLPTGISTIASATRFVSALVRLAGR
jgi:subtilase family serine protease